MASIIPTTRTGGTLASPAFTAGVWVEIPFAVRSKSNFRRYGSRERKVWETLKDFEEDLATLCRQHRPLGWDLGDASKPIARRPTVVAYCFARTTLDAGNISKSILDAAEGVLYHNDASVRHVTSASERSRSEQGGVVGFALLPAGASLTAMRFAARELEDLSSAAMFAS